MSITRETMTDDDGSGTTGTIWNNTKLQAVYDSVETSWATNSYTPTWGNTGTANTTTSSTISGVYFKIGKLVYFQINLNWGASTASGNGVWTFTLPITATSIGMMGADVIYYDSSSGSLYRGTSVAASTTVINMYSNASPLTGVSVTVPFTWASGDAVYISGCYVAA